MPIEAYLRINITIWIMLNPVTPNSEPSEPHSVRKINKTMPIKQPKIISAHQPQSQGKQNQNSPMVEAIPLPPLNFIVTGKICPMMTNTPQKYRVKSDTCTSVFAKRTSR